MNPDNEQQRGLCSLTMQFLTRGRELICFSKYTILLKLWLLAVFIQRWTVNCIIFEVFIFLPLWLLVNAVQCPHRILWNAYRLCPGHLLCLLIIILAILCHLKFAFYSRRSFLLAKCCREIYVESVELVLMHVVMTSKNCFHMQSLQVRCL